VNRIQKTLILAAAVALRPRALDLCADREDPLFRQRRHHLPDRAQRCGARLPHQDRGHSAKPDLRMRLSTAPRRPISFWSTTSAPGKQAPCRSSTPIRTVALDADTAMPDVTVTLSAEAALSDYKIYVHSVRFSQQDAAALLAAMWKTDQRREATGSIR
jgi:hypothetical protein